MFKRDPKGRFSSREQGSFFWKKLYWRFQSGRSYAEELDNKAYGSLMEQQQQRPVTVMTDPLSNKTWWMFKDEFYWEDEQFSVREVAILIIDNIKQRKKRVERAAARINRGSSRLTRRRQPIPGDVKVNVWQRDRGRCVNAAAKKLLNSITLSPCPKEGATLHATFSCFAKSATAKKQGT